VTYFAERGKPPELGMQRQALPIRVFSRRITNSFSSPDRLGEFKTSNQRVTRALALLTF